MKTLLALALTLSLSTSFANTRHNTNQTSGSTNTTGSAKGTFASEAAPENDSVSTGQSATVRDRNYAPSATSCTDTNGRVYEKNEVGYSSCKAHMRTR